MYLLPTYPSITNLLTLAVKSALRKKGPNILIMRWRQKKIIWKLSSLTWACWVRFRFNCNRGNLQLWLPKTRASVQQYSLVWSCPEVVSTMVQWAGEGWCQGPACPTPSRYKHAVPLWVHSSTCKVYLPSPCTRYVSWTTLIMSHLHFKNFSYCFTFGSTD